MISWSISPIQGTSWYLFADEYTGFSASEDVLPDISLILQEVNRVFVETLGSEVIKSHPVLSVLYSSDCYPVTYRKHLLIFLSSRGRFYHNHAYQYAHELCHFMVLNDTCPEYQWLNEVLCHTMSWYALYHINRTQKPNPGKLLNFFYEGLTEHLENSMNNRLNLRGTSIPTIIRQNWEYLHRNPTNRPLNDAIAYEIYPLFCEHPELWKIVPYLDQLKSDMDLNNALRTLIKSAGLSPHIGDLFNQRLLGK